MADKVDELPAALKWQLKNSLLAQLKGDQGLDVFELSLFEWYVRKNAKLIDQMLSAERAYIQEPRKNGVGVIFD